MGREVVLLNEIKLPLFGLLQAIDGVVDGSVVLADVERALGQDEADGEVGLRGLTSGEVKDRRVFGSLPPSRHTQRV